MSVQAHMSIRGGYYTYTAYSGTLGDVFITQSGQTRGRLNTLTFTNFQQMLSGGVVTFYDAPVATSGGPFGLSGHIVLYQLPGWPYGNNVSGQNAPIQTPINVDCPFFSGMCVATRSGTPGFTVSWTVEKPLY